MPSLSPPPLKQRTSAPKLTTSSSSVITSAAPITTKATANSNLESEADARLRDPQWPTRSSSSSSTAFGGKRRSGRTDMGLKQREWVILAGIMVVGCGVRFYKIGWPTSVV